MANSVFDELVGQEHVIEILRGAVAASRTGKVSHEITHAWIFTGPPGSGRSVAAGAFAQALICPNYGCGTCNECQSAKSHGHPDVEIVRTEGLSIKVEDIRALLTRVAWAPSMAGCRIVVLEDADRLTESAANALLKAIEEPGARTIWLLCAPTLHDVLPTIRSRCRHLQLRTPGLDAITKVLVTRNGISPGMADLIARVSQGHIGRANLLARSETMRSNRKKIMCLPLQLESLPAAFHAAKFLVDLATAEANASSEKHDEMEIEKLQVAYGKGATGRGMALGGAKAVRELEKELKSRTTRIIRDSIDGALLDIATFFRDVMIMQAGNPNLVINTDMRDVMERYAAKSSSHSTIYKIAAIMEARESLARNAAPLVTCEALMCRLAKQ